MSEAIRSTGPEDGGTAVVHESYSFACMRCGYGWEQSYEIEHYRGADGRALVRYVADGLPVPSPLTRPTCPSCDHHVVRIMGAGRVASVRGTPHGVHRVPSAGPVEVPGVPEAADRRPDRGVRHWHLSDLLRVLHLRHRVG
ncbi:hypothetical protein [Streptomyces sp. SID8352]|uniref:hypothetical protein n=1 Tax=Streptomyces sp. SID8352 TaxID=2690338 RepID=UPI0013708D20|nr:hypothetical protein [Streptomyces sp. SID8352]MYU24005.1 hypothetical protein [Streptomyces sp. SID8352]